jgi:peptidyl-prolyl cis-trans isomerase C
MRKSFSLIFLLTLSLLALGLAGCGNGKSEQPPSLAVINGQPITKAEFAAYLKFKRVPDNGQKRRQLLLDQYLEREALAAAIEKTDLLDKELIEAELNEFRKEMLISRYFEKFLEDKVTDQAVQNYYNTHAADYEERMAHAAHILIRTNPKMSETERKAKLTTAQDAYSQIRAGKDFAEIAENYSEDRISAQKGGDLGWLKEGSIDPRFSKILFELEPGAVSEPFETPFGFHIVKLIEGPKVVKRPLSAVAGDIRYQLRNKAKQAELERLLAEVKIKKYEKWGADERR